MITEVASYILFAFAIVLSLTYWHLLEGVEPLVVMLMAGAISCSSASLSLVRYHHAVRAEQREGAGERHVVWTPLMDLEYDLLGWVVFLAIIALSALTSSGVQAVTLVQATFAVVAFQFAKKLFIREISL